MGLRINTNVASLNAQRNAEARQIKVNNALERLSSGLRINKASDDAAGMAIAKKFEGKVAGYKQAKRNAMDGISLIQTAEGGLNETGNILNRLRELSVQAASDTVGNGEREFLNMEYDALVKEVKRIGDSTEFNGVKLLAGTSGNKGMGDMEIQVGIYSDASVDRFHFNPNDADASPTALGLADTGIATKESAQAVISKIDSSIMQVSGMRAKFGALQNRLQSTVANVSTSVENMSAAQSRIQDADIAYETAELAKNNVLNQASAAVLAQANASSGIALKLIG
jgi:flagellin